MSKGLEIEKVITVYRFKQEYYLKDFIDKNIHSRSVEMNPFKKTALKKVSNSIFGRTLMNPLNYATRTTVCSTESALLKNVSKSSFRKLDLISDTRVLVTHNKPCVEVKSPIYIGFAILDYAKLIMYKFVYDVLLHTYKDNIKLCYSDTDSLIVNIFTEDIEKELEGPLSQYLDLSNFPKTHRLYSDKWKGKLGKLKVETQSDIMTELVAVRPKCYSFLTKTSHSNAIKGVPYDVQRTISHQNFVDCVMKNERVFRKIYSIRNCRGEMSTTVSHKLALSSFEDKRFYLTQTESVAYGHPLSIRERSTTNEVEEGGSRPGKGGGTLGEEGGEPLPSASQNSSNTGVVQKELELWKERNMKCVDLLKKRAVSQPGMSNIAGKKRKKMGEHFSSGSSDES